MTLNILIAHKPEAQGIIKQFSLARDTDYPEHAIYIGEHIKLGICGTGYQRCQAMTEMLYSQSSLSPFLDKESDFWLNYGTAGTSEFSVGELVVAKSVVYPSISRQWELNNLLDGVLNSILNLGVVRTVDSVDEAYKGSEVYEMEAAGMLSVLEEIGCLQRAVVLKLVSDGPELPVNNQSRQQIIALLAKSEPRIQILVDALLNQVVESSTGSSSDSNTAI